MKVSVKKQNWPFVRKELCHCSTVDFKICLRIREVTGPFEKQVSGWLKMLFYPDTLSCVLEPICT